MRRWTKIHVKNKKLLRHRYAFSLNQVQFDFSQVCKCEYDCLSHSPLKTLSNDDFVKQ